jgi:hypothetical protein
MRVNQGLGLAVASAERETIMPDEKTYVKVATFAVTKPFDAKYASSLPKVMLKVAETAIDKSRKLSSTPTDKKAGGFYLDGTLTSLQKSTKGAETMLSAEISLQLADWPKKSMFGFASASAKMPAGNPNKLDDDVEYLVKDLVKSVMSDKVIKEFEKRL